MEHALIVHLPLIDAPFGSGREREIIAGLADELQNAIGESSLGEFDGEEFGGGRCVIYMYGPDADLLFAVVEPIWRAAPLARGGLAIKRYGKAEEGSALEVRAYL
ncbi:hypothetical protein [Rhizobium halophytocola]|uniref:Uncharacterized protein n=1 Tax=Rhizobium halophytocola TaxID=735519 RepID=A0ABS4E3J2_9HYPH|nr:hypothetical protein [Rhizobium halophytocola]MBP1852504.1 hypothetical protein [Rhizobium halophytocola]